jgi:hypothetical protein
MRKPIKALLIIGVVFTTFFVFFGCACAWAEDAGIPASPPKMVLKERVFDFGEIMEGKVLKHEFIVLNKGKGRLEISKVVPACGCSVASFDECIDPGKEGKIKVSVRTKGSQGGINKKFRVQTNDPGAGSFNLAVRAFVKLPVYVSPHYVYFTGREGRTLSKEVEIRAGMDKFLKLTPAEFTLKDKLKYKLEETEKGRKFKVILTTLPVKPENWSGFLNLKTNYPESPVIRIGIGGQFVGMKRELN